MYLLPEHSITTLDTIHCMDALAMLRAMPEQSVDMILCDLPYGITSCDWDHIIPLEPMWAGFKRVIKPRGAIVLTTSQPFTSRLVCSNLEMYRYEGIWEKDNGTNFLNARFQPLKVHESYQVFSLSAGSYSPAGSMNYYPQMSKGRAYSTIRSWNGSHPFHTSPNKKSETINTGTRYPRSVVKFSEERGLHPTQKPVALFEYLIRTYTQPGEVVLDPTCGSGTTAVAARQTGRRFICGDISPEWVAIARNRLRNTDPFQARDVAPGVVQPSLFEVQR